MKLDQLYKKYQNLYIKEKKLAQMQTENKERQEEKHNENLKLKAKHQQQTFKQGLDDQVAERQEKKLDEQILKVIQALKTEEAFEKNENLHLLNPKITEDYKARKKHRLMVLQRGEELQQEINFKQAKQKQDRLQDQQYFNQQFELLAKQMKDVTEARTQARKELQQTVKTDLKNQIVCQGVQKKSRKEQKQLYSEIVYGALKDNKKVSVSCPDPSFERKKIIMQKQRENAEQKATQHILNVQRPYQYAEVEIDPMPEMPLDNVQWGYVATSYVPVSHYNATFLDPRIMMQRRQQVVEAVKEGTIDDEVLDQIERDLGMDNQNDQTLDSQSQNEESNEELAQEAAVDQQDQAEPCAVEANSRNGEMKIEDQFTSISEISKIDRKTVLTAKSVQSKNSIFSKISKIIVPQPFENRSTRTNISKEQSRVDKSLQKITQKALDNFDLPIYKQTHQDTTSVASNMIKRKIRKSIAENVEKQGQSENLTHAQAKAQLDALGRFVESMESEAVELKRIAEERRACNQNNDAATLNIQNRRKAMQHMTKMYQLNQISDKKNSNFEEERKAKMTPHIQGNEGYPPQYQPSAEQAELEKQARQNYLAAGLVQQMIDNQRQKNIDLSLNQAADEEYQNGFKTVKTTDEFRHTTGNMGKLGSFTQDELDRKKKELTEAKEIWQKTIKLAKIKQDVQKLNIHVHEDGKLGMLINQKDQELQKLIGKSKEDIEELSEVTRVTQAETEARAKSTGRIRLKSQAQNRLKVNIVNVDQLSQFQRRANSTMKEEQFEIKNVNSLPAGIKTNAKIQDTLNQTQEIQQKIQNQMDFRKTENNAQSHVMRLNSSFSPNKNQDEGSAWSNISGKGNGIKTNEKINRKRERRNIKSPNQNNEVKNDDLVDENLVYPWEKRTKMNFQQYKNQISRKPHHEYRYDILM